MRINGGDRREFARIFPLKVIPVARTLVKIRLRKYSGFTADRFVQHYAVAHEDRATTTSREGGDFVWSYHRVDRALPHLGFDLLVIKIGLADLPPISFAAFRFVIAAAVCIAISSGVFRLPSGKIILCSRSPAFSCLGSTTACSSGASNSSHQAWLPFCRRSFQRLGLVFAHFYLPNERLKWERVLGALLALGGVTIICAKLLDFQGIMAFWGGVGIVVGAAAASYSNVLIKARRKKFAPSMISAWQMLFALPPLLLIGFLHEGNPAHFHWSKTAIFCLLYLFVSRIGRRLPDVLLADESRSRDQSAHHLAYHSAARGRNRMVRCRRNTFALGDSRCGFRSRWYSADPVEKPGAGNNKGSCRGRLIIFLSPISAVEK